jgi:endonuclease III
MSGTTNWAEAIRPLLKKYRKKKHPLDYQNVYQLIVMVVLSAQSTDDLINKLAPEGIIVDLHVMRVAPRLGIATGTDPKKVEQQLMTSLPKKEWDAGMAMSFLGREICRPKPKCGICLMNPICTFYKESK